MQRSYLIESSFYKLLGIGKKKLLRKEKNIRHRPIDVAFVWNDVRELKNVYNLNKTYFFGDIPQIKLITAEFTAGGFRIAPPAFQCIY